MDDKMKHASEYKCIECGAAAVCFWPACDPDIPSHPYCRPCVERAKIRVLARIAEMDERDDH